MKFAVKKKPTLVEQWWCWAASLKIVLPNVRHAEKKRHLKSEREPGRLAFDHQEHKLLRSGFSLGCGLTLPEGVNGTFVTRECEGRRLKAKVQLDEEKPYVVRASSWT